MTKISPETFLSSLDTMENQVLLAGGEISFTEKYEVLLSGLHPNFYGTWIRDTRITYDDVAKTQELYEKLREEIKKFYSASPMELRQPYEKKAAFGTGKVYEQRNCEYCADKRPRIAKPHNTKDCKQKVWDLEKDDKKLVAAVEKVGNKADQQYYDSCATDHFSNAPPENLDQTKTGLLETANGSKSKIVGTGSIKFGSISLKDVNFVPTLKLNLISAGKLAKDGFKTTMEHDNTSKKQDLKITKEESWNASVENL
jgi:hypothetical protein